MKKRERKMALLRKLCRWNGGTETMGRALGYATVGAALASSWSHVVSTEREPPEFDRFFISRPAMKVIPAVVNIQFSASEMMGLRKTMGGGSGFVYSEEGLILTNAHVVEGRKSRKRKDGDLKVTLQDGRSFPAEVVNTDRLSDLAVVKVLGLDDEKLPTVEFGDSTKVRLGEWVIACGSPLMLQNTVTAGIVSCVERKRTELGIPGSRTDYIQTDAAINVGNSGGPLVNLRGEVIGINTIKAAAADSIAFAIPIETAKFVIKQIQRHGRVVRPYIGIKMLDLTPETADMVRARDPSFSKAVNSGVFVPQVTPGSPAEAAGFRAGDVILEFDRRPVASGDEIIQLLGTEIGNRHQAVVARDPHGEKKVLYVKSEENVS